jgi:alpha-ketoglutarate-dependent 2,4-dichlorophenoxyacetate dioxygenase
MSITIERVGPTLAARVTGIDVRRPLDPAEVAAIEAGMDEHAVLIFPDQRIDDAQQMAFTLNFGALEDGTGGNITRKHQARLAAGMNDVSNLDEHGRPLARDDRRRMFNLGNQLWHSDSSFRATPAKYSILSGRVVATTGGNTEFADMRAAYDALDAATQREVEDLVCEHSLIYSRGSLGFTELTEEERAMFTPVRQRLVRRHPKTGRRSLYLSSHAGTILGWPVPEARAFLRDLTEHATQREFVYIHRWRPFDLVMWDNRQTIHRVRRFDPDQVRDVRRTTVAGDGPTYVAVQPAPPAYATTAA